MTHEQLRRMAVSTLRSAMEVAEELTDAGTKDEPIPETIDELADEAYDRQRERDDE